MLEENNSKELIESENKNAPLTLTEDASIVDSIMAAGTKDELEKQFQLFNLAMSKKNAIRIIKLDSLLDKVEDQAAIRITEKPDQISNRELLDYMQALSGQIDRAQKSVDSLKDKQVVNSIQKNDITVNVGVDALNRDQKENVVNAVQSLLKQLQNRDANKEKTELDTVIPTIDSVSLENTEENNCIVNVDEKFEEGIDE